MSQPKLKLIPKRPNGSINDFQLAENYRKMYHSLNRLLLLVSTIRNVYHGSDAERITTHIMNSEAYREAVAAIKQIHPKIRHGKCSVCGHYGEDCTGAE